MADVSNVKIEEQLNKLLLDRRAMLMAQTREMQSQLQLSLQMKALMDGMKSEEMLERLSEAQKVVEALAESTKAAGTTGEEAMASIATGAQKATTNASKLQVQTKLLAAKFPALKSVSAAALTGLSQGFTNLMALGKGFGGAIEGIVSGMFNVGKAILSIPLNIFSKLVDKAGEFVGDTGLAKAFEDLRKDFGSFKEDVSKNVIGSFQAINKGLTGTGLSAMQVFESFADRLKYFHEMAKGAGAQMHQFGEEIKNNAGLIAGLDKGLGVGADNIKAYMDLATVKGKTLGETMLQTANYSLQMGKEFGMSQKVLAKDISMMMKDVKNFGSLTQKEMSVAAVYTRKLGIEVKSLLGLIDKFDTFEDAANSAAQLSQAFGTSVDAFKLMNEQDPAKRLDMLRQSMAAAGKSSENMSRQELKLLENTTGLDAATAKLAFSSKNQGLSYDQVRKASEKAEKKQLTQAEAMSKLADSIERVIRQGETMKGGFLAQFLEGFERGITWSKPFMAVMINIRRALWDTMQAGRKVGQMFVETFPGVNKLLTSFAAMFSKEKFSGLLNGIVQTFKDFFKDTTEGKFSLKELIKNLQKNFFDYFDSNSTLGKEFLDSGKTFLKTMAGIVGNGIKWVVETLTEGAGDLAEFITNPAAFLEKLSGAGGGAFAGAMEILQPLIDALGDKKLWMGLYDAFAKLFGVVFDKVADWFKGPTFSALVSKYWPVVAAVMFGPALTRVLAATFLESVAKVFLGGSGKAIEAAMAKGTAKLAAGAEKSAGMGGNVSKNLSKSVPDSKSMGATKVFVKQASGINVKTILTAGLVIAALAVLFYVGMPPLLSALAESAKSFEGISTKAVTSMLLSLVTVSGSLIAFSIAAGIMAKLKVDPVSATMGLLGVGVVVLAAAGTIVLMAHAMKGISPSLVESIGKSMLYMSGAFIGASVVVLAATAIGTLFVGSAGTAAVAAAVGLLAIGVVIGAMAAAIIGILVALDKTPLGPEIGEKTKAFSNVMDSVSKFGEMMARMLEATRPSWLELIGGQGSTENNLKQLNIFISNFIGSESGGVTGIIKLIQKAVEQFKSPQIMKGAEVFASTLTAVSAMATSLIPSPESKSGLDSFLNFIRGESSDTQLNDITNYVKRFSGQITEFMGVIMKTLGGMMTMNITDASLKGVQAFSAMSTAVGSLIKALIPSPEFLKSMRGMVVVAGQETGMTRMDPDALANMGTFMEKFLKGAGPLISVLTGDVMSKIMTAAEKLDVKSLEKVKIVGTIISSVAGLMSSLGDVINKGANSISREKTKDIEKTVVTVMPSLGSVLKNIQQYIPPLIETMIGIQVPNDSGLGAKVDLLKKMFEGISALANAFKSISGGVGQNIDWPMVKDGIAHLAAGLNDLFFESGGNKGAHAAMPQLVEKIRYISAHSKDLLLSSTELGVFDTLKKTADVMKATAESLNTLSEASRSLVKINFDHLKPLMAAGPPTANGKGPMMSPVSGGDIVVSFIRGMVSFGSELVSASQGINEKAIAPSIKAVADTVKAVNELSNILASGDMAKMNVATNLKKFVDGTGLGQGGTYTIQNKSIVMNVHFEIKMSAAELEEVIVMRKDSIIKDGLTGTLTQGENDKLAKLHR